MGTPFTIYFAGALFTHKELIGNALLASYIARQSQGRYTCVLPQDLEQATARAVDIRNQDLKLVMLCDLAIFNFDGSDLDSGTVVEFMFAKFLDIPAVLVRSDFRSAGDQLKDSDPWNLMCSFYPRTRLVQFNAMAWYQEVMQTAATLADALPRLYERMATELIAQLDAVRSEPPLPKDHQQTIENLYRWVLRFPGGGFSDACAEPQFIERLISRKVSQGLL